MIIFVGDCPSKFNHDPDVAFVGTKSGNVLEKWIHTMGISGDCMWKNSHINALVREIARLHNQYGYTVVALGNKASERLNEVNVPHFKLPHPSPKNFKLNDKEYINLELKKCAEYIASKTSVYNENYSC